MTPEISNFMGLDKDAIRREMRARRKALSDEMRNAASAAVCEKILSCSAVVALKAGSRALAVYLASPDEINLAPLIAPMLAAGACVVSPRWNGICYDLARLTGLGDAELRKGPMGILEPLKPKIVMPAAVAVWIVPGLAFTPDGGRLGYGGGWYDRLLAEANAKSLKLAVAHPFQVVRSLPLEPHDLRVDRVVVADPEFRITKGE